MVEGDGSIERGRVVSMWLIRRVKREQVKEREGGAEEGVAYL